MKILVDGKEAVLKEGSSFEYVSENPLFTEAENYSMDIEFPMKDCPQNILIFGALHVKGVDISTVSFPCEIITESFDKTGILTITEVNDSCVKGQFLEGMSQQNYENNLPDTLLCDIEYFVQNAEQGSADHDEWIHAGNSQYGWWTVYVAEKGSDDILRKTALSGICLWHFIELLCRKIGWSCDISVLRTIPGFDDIVIANNRNLNSMRSTVDARLLFRYNLPRWTPKEFFRQVCLYFGCYVNVDSGSKRVSFTSCNNAVAAAGVQELVVTDDFEVELQDTETPTYRGNLVYKLPDDCNPYSVNDCPWIRDVTEVVNITSSQINSYATESIDTETLDPVFDHRHLFHITDFGKDLAVYAYKERGEGSSYDEESPVATRKFFQFEILNQFENTTGKEEGEELKMCPANIELRFNYLTSQGQNRHDWYCAVFDLPLNPFETMDTIAGLAYGEHEEKDYFFDKLWIVLAKRGRESYYSGRNIYTRKYEPWRLAKVFDNQDDYEIYNSDIEVNDYSLALNNTGIQAVDELPRVNEAKIYRYKFLSKTLPDPKAIYVIKGKRYACLRLTAHFTVDGMSELIEGEFYEIVG